MQLHTLQATNEKSKKRIGRGGKRGTFSGRGTKGQKSRSGRRIRPAVRDLIIRLPKRRGFANPSVWPKPFSLNLADLAKNGKPIFQKGTVIDKDFLKKSGVLPSRHRGEVKLLGDGEIDTAITVSGLRVSQSAREKIEKAGGSVENQNTKIKLQNEKEKIKK